MIAMTAAEIASAVGGAVITGSGAEVVDADVVVDSRAAEAGSLFIALLGERVDGHDFVERARDAGAVAALVSRPVPEAQLAQILVSDTQRALGDLAREVLARVRAHGRPRVVAITGSVGKTTTKDLLAQILADRGSVIAPPGSLNNEVGLPLTVLRATSQTRFLVLEMGADAPGNLTYLTSIAPPDVAVVLAVGRAHLQGFGSVEAVAGAKAELVLGLAPGGVAVLNADDARVAAMAGMARERGNEVVRFGLAGSSEQRELEAFDVALDPAGRAGFTLAAGASRAPVALGVIGEHHVSNALAAAAAALALGWDVDDLARALSSAKALSPHRMQVVERADGVTVLDDSYNANPESMRAALKALVALAGRTRRSVAVLGEMRELGEASRGEHDAVGRLAVRFNVGLLIVVGEGAKPIHSAAEHEGSWGEEAAFVPDLEAAQALLADELRPGDVVLVKASNGAGLYHLADRLTGAAS